MEKTATTNSRFTKILIYVLILSGFILSSGKTASAKGDTQLLRIKTYNIATPDLADETVIYFDSNATSGYDPQFDAFKLLNTYEALPNIYTIAGNDKLAINGLPMIGKDEITIPLVIKVNSKGEYEVNFTEILNFPSDVEIFIIDSEKNITQNLKNKSIYTFTLKPTSPDGRFLIKFSRVIAEPEFEIQTEKISFTMYSNNSVLSIDILNSKISNLKSQLCIYNLAGQIVADEKNISAGTYNYTLPKGIYIVKLADNNSVTSRKIYIK
jgi:hypothetical protein